MDLDMVGFNSRLKEYMTEVKILEKTHPKQSIGLWTKICRFIVEFAKTDKCPRPIRPKLIAQAETILEKVKHFQQGESHSVFSSEIDKAANKVPKSAVKSTAKPGLDEAQMAAELMGLNVPEGIPDEGTPVNPADTQTPTKPPTSAAPFPPTAVAGTPSDPKQGSMSPKEWQSLSKLEEELKKMPENLKEVAPTAFSGKSIIAGTGGLQGVNLNDYKKETRTLDVTKADLGHSTPSSKTNFPPQSSSPFGANKGVDPNQFKPVGFAPDALKKMNSKADPFGPASLQDADKPSQRICFACGAALKPYEKVCPECGADN